MWLHIHRGTTGLACAELIFIEEIVDSASDDFLSFTGLRYGGLNYGIRNQLL